MERPEVFDSKHLQDKKIEALENIQTYSKEEAAQNFVVVNMVKMLRIPN